MYDIHLYCSPYAVSSVAHGQKLPDSCFMHCFLIQPSRQYALRAVHLHTVSSKRILECLWDEMKVLRYLTLEFPTFPPGGGGGRRRTPFSFWWSLVRTKSKNLLRLGIPRGFNYAHFKGSVVHGGDLTQELTPDYPRYPSPMTHPYCKLQCCTSTLL